MNAKYKVTGDKGRKQVLERINDNAYKLELPAELGPVSPTFNIADLKPYVGEEDEIASRTTSIQEGEDDEGIPTIDTTIALLPHRYKDLSHELVHFN